MISVTRFLNRICHRSPNLDDVIESNYSFNEASSIESIPRNFKKIITDMVQSNTGTLFIQKHHEYGAIFTRTDNGYRLYSKYGESFINSLIMYIRDESHNFKKDIQYEINGSKISIKALLASEDNQFCEVQLNLIANHINRPLINLEKLGFSEKEASSLMKNAILPGLTLIAGPSFSGKSTTFYYLLLSIKNNFDDKRFVYIDRESRFEIPDITLVKNYDSERLDRILESNPDVIGMVDIKSQEEMEFIYKASMMGIRVIATMKCVSPISALYRINSFGITHHQIMSQDFVKTIVFQNLCRKLCNTCSLPLHQDRKEGHERQHNPDGCTICNASGWSGQHLLVEILHYPHLQKLFANTLNKEGVGINHHFANENQSILKDKAILAIEDGICDRRDISWHISISK